jgi:signal transduction histidine kinase/DNA-binding response OmpR family regulator
MTVLLAVVLALSQVGPAAGQGGAAGNEQVPHRAYSPREGLPSEHIRAITQTPDGRLWIGTLAGIAYFDGFRFHEVPFPEAVGRPIVSSLVPLADNSLWVMTPTLGVWHLSQDLQLRREEAFGDLGSITVLQRGTDTFFLGTTDAWIWPAGAGQPLRLGYGYDITTPSHARTVPIGSVGTGPGHAVIAPDGRIIVLDGLLGPGAFEPVRGTTFKSGHHGAWRKMAYDATGTLWALDFDRGLFRFDEDLGAHLALPVETGLTLSIRGNVAYIGTRDALLVYDLETLTLLEVLDDGRGVPLSGLNVVYWDREESLWIGTRTHLVHVPWPRARHFTRIGGERLVNAYIGAPMIDGELWAAAYEVGLVRLLPSPRIERPFASNRWTVVSASADGHLFAIGNAGVARLEPSSGWREAMSVPNAVRGVAGTADIAYVWTDRGAIGTLFGDGSRLALYRWASDARDYHAVGSAPGGDFVIRAMDLLLQGRVSADGRSVRLDTLARLGGLERARGRALAVDGGGAVWLGFWDRGLVRVHDGVVTSPLPGEYVHHLTVSGDTLLFVSTSRGLFAFDTRTVDLAFWLTHDDGLISSTTSGAAIAGDVLYVAHPGGISALPVGLVRQPVPEPPHVHLSPMETPGGGATRPRLPPDASFRFFATSYVNPGAISYEYRLGEGVWVAAEGNVLHFSGLRGGTHALEVRARFKGGSPGPPAQYVFSVPTPYHQRVWVRVLMGLLVVLAAALVYAARVRDLKRRELELSALVEERTWRLAESMRTTRRQAELLEVQDELKTRFFTNISHEFRTPLTLVVGIVRDLLRGRHGEIGEEATHRLHLVADSAGRLSQLVDELLDLARLEAGRMQLKPRPGDVITAIQSVIAAHQPAAERADVRIAFHCGVETYPALFDGRAIDRVVSNLLSNALKHTPPGGNVEVDLTALADSTGVVVKVRDNGGGIPEDLLPHIFERFVLGAEQPGSSGIGLALVKELVGLHGGGIEVESRVGEGSCFSVTLPLDRATQMGDGEGAVPLREVEVSIITPASAPSPVELRPDAPTILLVDDNDDVRTYVAQHLAAQYGVIEATNGEEALRAMRECEPDLVVSDVMMPGMTGEELCQHIRVDPQLAHIPIILLTARAGGAAVVKGIEAGADDYLLKPFEVEVLLARIARLIEGRRTLKDAYSRSVVLQGLDVEVDSADEELLRAVLEVIENQSELSMFGVEELAAEVGVSPRHLRRRLRQATGETPAELLRRYRLERAARLLEAGAGNVAQVAARVGYAKASAFASQFGKRFGVTPSDYARGVREGGTEGASEPGATNSA